MTEGTVVTSDSPLSTAAPAPQPIPTPEQARAELEQLRVSRVNGQVTQRDYLERSDFLARIAHGEQGVERPPERLEYLPPEEQEARLIDEVMQPGRPEQYQIPPLSSSTDEKFEAVMRDAMATAGIPARLGGTLAGQVDRLLSQFSKADPDAVIKHYQATGERLRQDWGDQYSARVQAVNDLLADVAEQNPLVANLLDRRPFAFSDPWIMQTLWMVADHRNRTQQRKG